MRLWQNVDVHYQRKRYNTEKTTDENGGRRRTMEDDEGQQISRNGGREKLICIFQCKPVSVDTETARESIRSRT